MGKSWYFMLWIARAWHLITWILSLHGEAQSATGKSIKPLRLLISKEQKVNRENIREKSESYLIYCKPFTPLLSSIPSTWIPELPYISSSTDSEMISAIKWEHKATQQVKIFIISECRCCQSGEIWRVCLCSCLFMLSPSFGKNT